MNKENNDLVKLAIDTKKMAYTPYSKFQVGSVLVTKNGIFNGANIENSSYSLSMCAERNAIFKAVLEGCKKGDFLKIIVNGNTEKPIVPCGACLQVMNEFFDKDTEIILSDKDGNFKVYNFCDLLPMGFSNLD
jgi:cytidine deaminase